jgi:hypothetical protein
LFVVFLGVVWWVFGDECGVVFGVVVCCVLCFYGGGVLFLGFFVCVLFVWGWFGKGVLGFCLFVFFWCGVLGCVWWCLLLVLVGCGVLFMFLGDGCLFV